MDIQFEAICEGGLLRPLTPVVLPEKERVTVTVQTNASAQNQYGEADAETLLRQKKAIQEMLAEARKFPFPPNTDGFDAADHDDLLYGHSQ